MIMAISSPTRAVVAETSLATSVQRDSPLTRNSLITTGLWRSIATPQSMRKVRRLKTGARVSRCVWSGT
ncbi:ubiquitin-like, containing PHD and RING finger domains, 1 (mapped), isoform CRA_b [Rattus norvegicus]|uniref:Ubiquitin-like, containing PHD and RING finger domains, 1 (Mapped), isoform CRA_b n=1 Tax=Rattus norvegicus TaxID=10116 RepID=A6KQY7_RAT|nr:ubiquitin-like, containing PHD and RING finger domains, 1 (mapped), isoform CRA_b [Rattus norvegicus]